MTGSITYQIKEAGISKENMEFNVTSRRPKYSIKERQTVKAEVEQRLFAVFCKYV